MIQIDDAMIAAHGIKIADEDKPAFLEQLQAQVEEQVGLTIIAKLKDEDAQHLLELTRSASEADVTAWMEANVPDYQQVVEKEVDTVLTDIAGSQR